MLHFWACPIGLERSLVLIIAVIVHAHRGHPSRLLSKPFPSRFSSWWSQPDLNSATCEFPQLFSHKPFTSLNLLVFPLSKLSFLQDYDSLNVGTMFLFISSLVFYFLPLYMCFVWLIWTKQPNCHLTVLVIFSLCTLKVNVHKSMLFISDICNKLFYIFLCCYH